MSSKQIREGRPASRKDRPGGGWGAEAPNLIEELRGTSPANLEAICEAPKRLALHRLSEARTSCLRLGGVVSFRP